MRIRCNPPMHASCIEMMARRMYERIMRFVKGRMLPYMTRLRERYAEGEAANEAQDND